MSFDPFFAMFVSLFVIADPLGTAAVFSALTHDMGKDDARKLAIRAALTAAGLLIFFGLAGKFLLTTLGISLPAFRIAGGLLLFVTGFRMIMGFHDRDKIASGRGVYRDMSDLAVFPLAIPLLAGPGCMTATVLHMTAHTDMMSKAMVLTAIVLVEIIALFSMVGADRLSRVFGPTMSSILARLMGVLMAAISVQFIADGMIEIVRTF